MARVDPKVRVVDRELMFQVQIDGGIVAMLEYERRDRRVVMERAGDFAARLRTALRGYTRPGAPAPERPSKKRAARPRRRSK